MRKFWQNYRKFAMLLINLLKVFNRFATRALTCSRHTTLHSGNTAAYSPLIQSVIHIHCTACFRNKSKNLFSNFGRHETGYFNVLWDFKYCLCLKQVSKNILWHVFLNIALKFCICTFHEIVKFFNLIQGIKTQYYMKSQQKNIYLI